MASGSFLDLPDRGESLKKMFNSQIEVGSRSEKLVKLSEWLGYIVIVICINYSD